MAAQEQELIERKICRTEATGAFLIGPSFIAIAAPSGTAPTLVNVNSTNGIVGYDGSNTLHVQDGNIRGKCGEDCRQIAAGSRGNGSRRIN
jgi:hypothetical protein